MGHFFLDRRYRDKKCTDFLLLPALNCKGGFPVPKGGAGKLIFRAEALLQFNQQWSRIGSNLSLNEENISPKLHPNWASLIKCLVCNGYLG